MFIQKKLSSFSLLFFSFAFLLIAAFSLSSCGKEEVEPLAEQSNNIVKVEVDIPSSNFNIYNSNCLSGVKSEDGVLAFESQEHFLEVYNCLKANYEQNITEFITPLEGMEEEEALRVADKAGFNTDAPLIQFEELHRGYISLRKSLEEKEAQWLESEELNPEEDPYYNLPVDRALATLLSPDMKVKIGAKSILAEGEITSRSCSSNFSKSSTKYCSSKKRFHGKMFIINFWSFSIAGGTTRAYRRIWLFGKRWVAAIFTKVYCNKSGYVYKKDCESKMIINNNTKWFYFYVQNAQLFWNNARHKPNAAHFRTRHWTSWCFQNIYLNN